MKAATLFIPGVAAPIKIGKRLLAEIREQNAKLDQKIKEKSIIRISDKIA